MTPSGQETRLTDPTTGAQKGMKIERFDLIPPVPLRYIATVYGFGSKKYDDNNWFKGYPWSWSVGALERHLNAWKAGEDVDPESGLPHLAHAAWHCITLMEFARSQRGADDRLVRCGSAPL